MLSGSGFRSGLWQLRLICYIFGKGVSPSSDPWGFLQWPVSAKVSLDLGVCEKRSFPLELQVVLMDVFRDGH